MSIQLFHLSIMNLDMMKIVFVISFIIPMCYSFNGDAFRNCSLLYKCGSLQNLGYPFWGGDRPDYCGRQDFSLECVDGQYTDIWLDHISYRVLGVDPSVPKMTIARNDIWNGICPDESSYYRNSTLSNFNLNSARTVRTLYIFYGCTSEVISTVQVKSNVTCSVNGVRSGVFFADEFVSGIEGCSMSLAVPIQLAAYNDLWDGKITLQKALNQGFDVEYNAALAACTSCEASGGKCGSNSNYEFICICQDQSYPMICPKRGSHRNRKIVLLATGTSAAGIGVIVCLVICYSILQFNKRSKQNLNLEAAIKQYGSITPKRYSYSDIKKMTNSFKDKLGKGGYGDVYKGNLFDNRPIAVKVLNTSKGSGEEFINEVASISRTSHVNVVTLLGFCLDGQKRALVYEFMPNGSLERHIHAETASVTAGHLGWKKLYHIALGIARGLEYLHRGCAMRIVHFDIKPHNILLDEDFCPKISDFGLSKLCTRKESIISMLEARGTIGYIAPEVFCRNFGCVSHKSDVYSYGMMLLEMVGGRKNIKIGVSHTSEIYFPHWVYQRVVLDEDLKLQGVMNPEEDEIARKMVLVGLWCIQTDPSQRPAMSKVIEMLEGSLQALEIPPKPVFGSPSTSPENSSTAIVVS